MKLTGISDEAGAPLDKQIAAHKELGWDSVEARFVEIPGFEKGSVHEIPDEAFDQFAAGLEEAGNLHKPSLDRVPAEFLVCSDLFFQRCARLI